MHNRINGRAMSKNTNDARQRPHIRQRNEKFELLKIGNLRDFGNYLAFFDLTSLCQSSILNLK
jgi:hypothetical protein